MPRALAPLLAVVAVLIAVPAAHAATWTVTKTADTNDGVCNADCSLREAMTEAGGDPGATVVVPAGTYTAAMLGANGAWSPGGQWTLVGAGAEQTIISGGGLSRTFAFYGQITVRGVTVTGGVAPNAGCSCGAGFQVRQGGFLTLEDSVVRDNQAAGGGGGGINVDGSSDAILRNVVIRGNSSPATGGGVRLEDGGPANGTLALTNVTVSGNSAATDGGGIAAAGKLTATNLTVSGNSATGGAGGGLFAAATTATTLNAATFAGNSAGTTGHGVHNAGAAANLAVRNTIFADLAAGACSGPLLSLGSNIDRGTTCGLGQSSDRPSTDPALGPLTDNGGRVTTHALAAGSPAIDAGDTAACPATDARGVTRPAGPACDIGAYEAPFTPPPAGGAPAPAGTPAPAAAAPVTALPSRRTTGPARLTLLARTVTFSRRGRTARLRVRCANVAGDRCTVAARLTVRVRGARRRAGRRPLRTITVATIAGRVAGGASGELVVTLTGEGRRRLGRSLATTVVGAARNAAGATTPLGGRMTLVRARRR